MPITTRRIPTISLEVNLARFFDGSFRTDCLPWRRFLLKVFFCHSVSAISEQERMIVFSFHADCLRGGNCRNILLKTVLLHSIDSIPPFSFTSFHQYSRLNPLIPDHEVLCSDHLIKVSSCHCLQLMITWPSIDFDLFLVHALPKLSDAAQTHVFAQCTNSPTHYLGAFHL